MQPAVPVTESYWTDRVIVSRWSFSASAVDGYVLGAYGSDGPFTGAVALGQVLKRIPDSCQGF